MLNSIVLQDSYRYLLAGFLSVLVSGLMFMQEARAQVYINEMLASAKNVAGALADEDGKYSDWIELYNAGSTAVNLEGYWLRSKKVKVTSWTFPAVTIEPHSYPLVFASGKNQAALSLPLHTNFAIDKDGEELTLFSKQGVQVDLLAAQALLPNQSYGYSSDGGGARVVFKTPSPGCANTASSMCVPKQAAAPIFSVSGGFFSTAPVVALTSTESSASIYYTLDGSEPTLLSQLYRGPISLPGPVDSNIPGPCCSRSSVRRREAA